MILGLDTEHKKLALIFIVLQADILNMKHNCDVVIMMRNRHGDGHTVTVYGTAGAGVAFIGNRNDVKISEGGDVALQLFMKFMKDYYSRSGSEHLTTASTTNDFTSELLTSSQEDHSESSSSCETPKDLNEVLPAAPSTLCNADTMSESEEAGALDRVQDKTAGAAVESSPPNNDTESESTEGGTLESVQDRTVGAALTSSSHNNVMVVYRRDSVVLAGGRLEESRREIHGKRVPTDHVCVLLTTAKPDVIAPFIAGDPDENSFLEKGKFFAFPKQFIYRASLLNGSLQLAPYNAPP